ncbi:MAG: hypothetical protein ACFE0Q_16300 [Anaerolineae bacterium]
MLWKINEFGQGIQSSFAGLQTLKKPPNYKMTLFANLPNSNPNSSPPLLRRIFRPKGAFHSLDGLLATVARVLNPKRLI